MFADLESAKAALTRWGFHGDLFLDEKFIRLTAILESLGSVAVAYSGGVDSAFLLRVASCVLGERAIGVLASSESLDRNELEDAKQSAAAMGLTIRIVETREYENAEYRKNDGSRCYHCKTELFTVVKSYALGQGIPYVLDGSNADDAGDFRPGLRARGEQNVRSPLLEAGLDKAAIRRFSKAMGLPTWDKPAAPCLSSRIPYGTEITHEKLRQVEAAEMGLRSLGFRICRVRHHDQIARIEVPSGDIPRLLDAEIRERAIDLVKKAGFLFVAVDLDGFRSGSLNAALDPAQRARGLGVVPVGDVGRF